MAPAPGSLRALIRRAAAGRPAGGTLPEARPGAMARLSLRPTGTHLAAGAVILGAFWAARDGGSLAAWPLLAACALALVATSHARFTDRLLARRALERQRLTIEVLLGDFEEGAGDWLWEVDASGRLRHVSKRLAGLTGRTADQLLGQPLLLLLDGIDPASVRGLTGALARGRPFRDVVVPLRVSGEARWWSLAAKPVVLDDGTFDGFRGVATERTDAKRAERALIEAKEAAEAASRAKTAFLATMSHELRTPLNAILGFADLIRAECHGPAGHPRYVEYAGDIVEGGTHLLAIINDILDTARIENNALSIMEAPCCLATLTESVRRMAEPLAAAAGLLLVVEEPAEEIDVRADGKRIRQILVNLVSNAVKFTPRGGRVTLGYRLGREGELLLFVADTGIGVAADQVEAVFEPFRQLDPSLSRAAGGTGLGLSIARRLARAHGGDLRFESRPGEGSRVTLTLPRERVLDGAPQRVAG